MIVVAPAAISEVVVRSSAPTWYSGPQASPRSALVKPNSTMCARFFHARLAWVIMTPLGRPVVPDVYIRRWTSSPGRWHARRSSASPRRSATRVHPSGAGRDAHADERASMPFVASFARSTSDSSHTSARASECSRMYRTSGGASRQLIGIAIAPRWFAAKIVSEELGAVVREETHDVAGADAALVQPAGQRAPRRHLPVGGRLAEHRDRPVRRPGRRGARARRTSSCPAASADPRNSYGAA